MGKAFVNTLRSLINQDWAMLKQGEFWRLAFNRPITKTLYYDLMIEIYHYTRHNSMNQATAAFIDAPEGLLKFVYSHAAEQLEHERLIINDLESIQLLERIDLQRPPLPATEALIGYLYFVALKYGPVARLGYSFWAKDMYIHIDELLAKIKHDLHLTDTNLSFFVTNAEADAKGIGEIEECIERYVKTPAEQGLIIQVARTTLFLTGQMLEQLAQLHM